MIKKYYELTRGERALHGDELLTFTHMDGAWAHWLDGEGRMRIGNALEYKKDNDENKNLSAMWIGRAIHE